MTRNRRRESMVVMKWRRKRRKKRHRIPRTENHKWMRMDGSPTKYFLFISLSNVCIVYVLLKTIIYPFYSSTCVLILCLAISLNRSSHLAFSTMPSTVILSRFAIRSNCLAIKSAEAVKTRSLQITFNSLILLLISWFAYRIMICALH